jgi:hypothetical protein
MTVVVNNHSELIVATTALIDGLDDDLAGGEGLPSHGEARRVRCSERRRTWGVDLGAARFCR